MPETEGESCFPIHPVCHQVDGRIGNPSYLSIQTNWCKYREKTPTSSLVLRESFQHCKSVSSFLLLIKQPSHVRFGPAFRGQYQIIRQVRKPISERVLEFLLISSPQSLEVVSVLVRLIAHNQYVQYCSILNIGDITAIRMYLM